MSVVTLFRSTLRRAPQIAATLRNTAGTETDAIVRDGVLREERRAFDRDTSAGRARREFAIEAEGLDFAPEIGMQLVVSGLTWGLVDVGIVEPTDAGAPILYRVMGER